MSSGSKVSIGIPSYNHAQFLPKAIESALGQTYANIEIVIVDDGSTDDSFAIAQSYELKYPAKIRVYSHPGRRNRGISATVNECFKRSSGIYFSGLPSDDVLLRDKVESQVAFLESHRQIGWVYSHAYFIDLRGNRLPGKFGEDISRDARPLEKLIIANAVPGMTVLARRECFEVVGAHNHELVYSDWEFWIRMAARYEVGFIPNMLVEYRLHSCNTSVGVNDQENLRRGLAVMSSLRQNASRFGGQIATLEIQALIELRRCRHLFYLNEKEEAAKSLWSVFENYPALQKGSRELARWLLASYEVPAFYQWMIEQLPSALESEVKKKTTRLLQGLTLARAAIEKYAAGDFQSARRLAIQAQIKDSRWLFDRLLISALTETLVGSPAMNTARHLKQQWL
jgi:alpha-1,3-rhamnosyltransferase